MGSESFGRDSISEETGKLLAILVMLKKPGSVLEIGTGYGYSTGRLAGAPYVLTIEKDSCRAETARKGLPSNINVVHGDALDVLKTLKTGFDLVFIDARKSEYLLYLKLIRLNENALIIADNVISHRERLKDYIAYVKSRFMSVTLPIGKGIELSVASSKVAE